MNELGIGRLGKGRGNLRQKQSAWLLTVQLKGRKSIDTGGKKTQFILDLANASTSALDVV